jgi:hypothetical protein
MDHIAQCVQIFVLVLEHLKLHIFLRILGHGPWFADWSFVCFVLHDLFLVCGQFGEHFLVFLLAAEGGGL